MVELNQIAMVGMLDPAAVAKLIGVTRRTLWSWVDAGTFPAPDVSRGHKLRRWLRATVETWIKQQSGAAQAQAVAHD